MHVMYRMKIIVYAKNTREKRYCSETYRDVQCTHEDFFPFINYGLQDFPSEGTKKKSILFKI